MVILINFKTGFLKSLFQKSSQEIVLVPEQLSGVKDFIDKCLETASKNSLYQIGRNGGYYKPPFETSIIWFIEEIPYYYLDNKILVPPVEIVENELEKSINENIGLCLNFTEFEEQGFVIKSDNATTRTKIMPESIEVEMDYSINIEKGSLKTERKNFFLKLDSDMFNLITTAEILVSVHSQKPQFICLTCLDKISDENEVIVDTYLIRDVSYFENNAVIYLIEDKKYQIDAERSLTLRFIVEQ